MDAINDFFTAFSSFLWGWPMIILLLGTHIFLTIRLRFPQRKIFKAIKLSVKKDKDATGDVSQFGALATALAATIGTGNIIGVATAIALGGPGAVLWCWLTGVFGISTKYAEGLLAVKYRVKTKRGRMLGGPMYALEKGLGWKWLAILFAIFAALASFGIGSTVQANAISSLVNNQYGISPYITGAIVTALGAAVILGGVKTISKVCGMLVPFMAIFYVIGCIYILIVNHAYLMPAIKIILESAFTTKAAGGGFAGSTLMMAARYGIARGLFSNEVWVQPLSWQLPHRLAIRYARLWFHPPVHSGTQSSSVPSQDWSSQVVSSLIQTSTITMEPPSPSRPSARYLISVRHCSPSDLPLSPSALPWDGATTASVAWNISRARSGCSPTGCSTS